MEVKCGSTIECIWPPLQLVGWFCFTSMGFTSHRQRGHVVTTIFSPLRRTWSSAVHYTTAAPHQLHSHCKTVGWRVRMLLVYLALTSLLNIWGHNATVPACSSGTLTNVLQHTGMSCCGYRTWHPHPVTVYIYSADLSLCYLLIWNITLAYTATHFYVLGKTQLGNPSPGLLHTPVNAELNNTDMVVAR